MIKIFGVVALAIKAVHRLSRRVRKVLTSFHPTSQAPATGGDGLVVDTTTGPGRILGDLPGKLRNNFKQVAHDAYVG